MDLDDSEHQVVALIGPSGSATSPLPRARCTACRVKKPPSAPALAYEPRLLLLDEITSALDPELVGEVLALVRELAGKGFARQVADQVIFLDHGAVVETGPPEQVLGDPRHDRTRLFLRRIIDAGRIWIPYRH